MAPIIHEKQFEAEMNVKLEFEIELAKQYLKLANLIKPILESYKDKKITKLIANAIEKALPPHHRIFYNTNYGMFHIDIWKVGENGFESPKDFPSDRKLSILLGYDSDPYLREKYLFSQTNTYYHPDSLAKTIANYEAMRPKVKGLVQRYAQIFRDREALENDAGPLCYWLPFNVR